MTFDLGAYGHVDHGYAATVHKAQGVTVDRAHVLAGRPMDRHAAYVALTRHRDGVALHWSAEELGDREGLTRTLGRERAKDTSLDYGGAGPEAEPARAAAYAERRGLDPLRPHSEIVVRPAPEASRPVAAQGERASRGIKRPEVAAGVAGWRARYQADKQRRAERAALDARARHLAQSWEGLIQGYGAALPRIERDPELKGTREALLRFGRGLREQPEAVEALRTRGEEFGMAERPNLAKLLSERDPEAVLRSWLDGHETTMRAELKRERQAERQRQAELARQQAQRREAERAAQRPSRGMSPG